MKQKRLWLLSGCPGSGKSTWAKKFVSDAKNPVAYISRDEIRFSMVPEDEEYFSKEDEVFETFQSKVSSALDGDEFNDVIADASHLNPKARFKFLNGISLNTDTEIIVVYFDISIDTCIKQNEYRTGRALVPRTVVRNMKKSMEPPTPEEVEVWFNKGIIMSTCFVREEEEE